MSESAPVPVDVSEADVDQEVDVEVGKLEAGEVAREIGDKVLQQTERVFRDGVFETPGDKAGFDKNPLNDKEKTSF